MSEGAVQASGQGQAERPPLGVRGKPEQIERVVANVGVHVQHHLAARAGGPIRPSAPAA